MTRKVVVIDYDVGNLASVRAALDHCGAECIFTADPEIIADAHRVLLPGVGAFGACIGSLKEKGLVEPILRFAQSGRPMFGICVGMQMLFDESEEFGLHPGFGLIPGKVAAIPSTGIDGRPHPLPHIGWSELLATSEWRGTVLEDITPGESVYFVHSFGAVPLDARYCLADCDYDGRRISAVVSRGNVFGCQFHPERSGSVGLAILHRFLKM